MSQGLAAPNLDISVSVPGRIPVDLDRLGGKIHQPGLRDAGAGIERNLPQPVMVDGRVRNLNEQEDVSPMISPSMSSRRSPSLRIPARTI